MTDRIKSIEEMSIQGLRCLIRVDFNTPLADGAVADDARIRACLPTIHHAVSQGARVILMSHLGRPKGKTVPELSMEPVAAALAELLEDEIILADSAVGDGARKVVHDLREGRICMLENLRFNPGETDNDDAFAAKLAQYADVYVNDAFGTAHREHASTYGVPMLVHEKCAGLLMIREIEALGRLTSNPKHPFTAILGGAKVSDKIGVIENLFNLVEAIIIGGAMANTFLAAGGFSLGRSMIESDRLALARDLLRRAEEKNVRILLPEDLVSAESLESESTRTVSVDDFPATEMALDIGPETLSKAAGVLKESATILWNGPMGVFEKEPFAHGTFEMAQIVADSPAYSVVGGGDSVAAVRRAGLEARFGHVSTGGGASLKYLEGKELPGIAALSVKED